MAQRWPGGDAGEGRALLTSTPVIVAVTLGYVAVLHHAYVAHIAPLFTYLRYGYRTPHPVNYGVAVALVVGLALVLPRRITHPSHVIVWALFLIAIVPSLLVPQWAPALGHGDALELALWVGACFGLVGILGTRRLLRGFVPRYPLPPGMFWLLVAGIFAALLGYALLTTGLNLTLPALDDVYGVRGEFHRQTSSNPALGYAVPLLSAIINPALMARGLWDRRPLWFLAGALGQLYVFTAVGDKSAFLSPLAIGAVFLVLRHGRRPAGAMALVGAAALAVAAMAIGWTSLFVRRFLVTPGLVLAGYVQVFDDAPKARLGHSVLSGLVAHPYRAEPPDLVGHYFFDHPQTHANTGWLGDGYANFGYPGMVAASVLLVLVLWAIDDAARGLPLGFTCLFLLPSALTLAESAILTGILTHGVLAAIVACALAPRTGWRRAGPVVAHDPARMPAERPPSRTPGRRDTW